MRADLDSGGVVRTTIDLEEELLDVIDVPDAFEYGEGVRRRDRSAEIPPETFRSSLERMQQLAQRVVCRVFNSGGMLQRLDEQIGCDGHDYVVRRSYYETITSHE